MKRRSLSVKQLADELAVHEEIIYRGYAKKTISGRKVCRVLRFDLDKVLRALDRKSEPRSESVTQRATGGESRRRANRNRPRQVRRGRS
jgi:hypothetical protein